MGLVRSLKSQNALVVLCVAALAVVSCVNTGSQGQPPGGSAAGTTATNKTIGGSNSGTLPGSSQSSFITLLKVVRSNTDPNATLDLIGQNGEIGTQCPNLNACVCVFNFTENNGVLREVEQIPSRTERDLFRCSFAAVTSDVKTFDVRIKILQANQFSNSQRVQVSSPNPSLDPSIGANYLAIQRYMCRDIIKDSKFRSNFYTGLVDPRIWDKSLVFNFYTSSLGADYGAVPDNGTTGGNTNVDGFECPLVPNNVAENPLFDLRVESEAPIDISNPNLSGGAVVGDNTIFPVDDNTGNAANCPTGKELGCEQFKINRSDFYGAIFQNGIFKEPLCLIHRVSNISGTNNKLRCSIDPDTNKGSVVLGSARLDQGRDIIGFAAVPDVNQNCPDPSIVKIPAGKKWAKLWQFRASYTARTINDIGNKDDIQDLLCTNRNLECVGVGRSNGVVLAENSVCLNGGPSAQAVVPNPAGPLIGPQPSATLDGTAGTPGFGNCSRNSNSGGDGFGDISAVDGSLPTHLTGAAGFATFEGTPINCTSDVAPLGTAATFCCQDIGLKSGIGADLNNKPANFTPGGDFCTPTLIGQNHATDAGGAALDVWLMGNGNRRACIEADTNANGALASQVFPPVNPNPFIMAPRNIDANSSFDFIYVVTPPSVTVEIMQDPTNAVFKQYHPIRKMNVDGSITTVPYGLESGSQNTADPNQRLARFPLCVLQDAKP